MKTLEASCECGPDYVRRLGADQVIDTKSQNLAELGIGADIVIDTVGGKNQDQLFVLLKPGGVIVSSVIRPNVQLAKQHGVQSDYLIVDVNTDQLTQLAQLHERHELTIPVGSVLWLTRLRRTKCSLARALTNQEKSSSK